MWKVNPSVDHLFCELHCPIQSLITEGWDLADLYNNAGEDYVNRRYDILITLSNGPTALWCVYDYDTRESGEPEMADSRMVIADICNLLDAGQVSFDSFADLSTNSHGEYVDAFIQ